MITPDEYQALAMRTECSQARARHRITYPGVTVPASIDSAPEITAAARCLHAAIGLSGEAGEIATMMQRWLWYG